VYGQRASRADESRLRRFSSRAIYRVINSLSLSGELILSDAGDFRILSRRAVDVWPGLASDIDI
jgi:hypothetical protein